MHTIDFPSIEESIGPLFAFTCASAYVPLLIPNVSSSVHNYSHELIATTTSVCLVRIRFNVSEQRRRPCFAAVIANLLRVPRIHLFVLRIYFTCRIH